MIRRISDDCNLSKENLEKIAEIVAKKESNELFDIVDKDKVELVKKQLRLQGFDVKVEPFGDKFKVFAIVPEKVKFIDAIESGAFKKLAWGRYCFQRESSIGMFKYDFDEGSVWKVVKDASTGEEYLVKEVCDNNTEEVIRIKVASANDLNMVNDNNADVIIGMLYNSIDKELLNDIVKNTDIKSGFYNMLNKKLGQTIEEIAENNHFIKSPDYINDLKSIVSTALNNKEIDSKQKLNGLIIDYSNQLIAKTGKINKLFE